MKVGRRRGRWRLLTACAMWCDAYEWSPGPACPAASLGLVCSGTNVTRNNVPGWRPETPLNGRDDGPLCCAAAAIRNSSTQSSPAVGSDTLLWGPFLALRQL